MKRTFDYRLRRAENDKQLLAVLAQEDAHEFGHHGWEVVGFTATADGGYEILLRRPHPDSYGA
jgi:hypothetical protein